MLENKIIEALKTVFDHEIPVNVYDLGFIYEISIENDNDVYIVMTLTSPNCPIADSILQEVKEKVNDIDEVNKCSVELTFEPSWNKSMMSEEAKFELGFL